MRVFALSCTVLVSFLVAACGPASSESPAPTEPARVSAQAEAPPDDAPVRASDTAPDGKAPDGNASDRTASDRTASVSASPVRPASVDSNDVRSVAERIRDATTATRVKKALVRDEALRVFDFNPDVVAGHVTLRGDVNAPSQYRRVEQIVRSVDGVDALTNALTVQGRPVSDSAVADAQPAASPNDDAMAYHTVRNGDTLWRIAREYRASVERIRDLNDLRSGTLQPGQRIRVR